MPFRRKKNTIKIIFVRPIGEREFEKIGEKRIKKDEEAVTYKEKTFPLTSKCYMYFNKHLPHIFVDYENEKILKFHDKSIGINAKFLDMLLTTSKRGIIGQLMYSLNLDMKTKTEWGKFLSPVVIFILGAVIGYLVGSPQI